MSTSIANQPAASSPNALSASARLERSDGPATPDTARARAYPIAQRQADIAQRCDATLLEQAHAGDAAAFAAIYDRHAGAAYSLARHMMHSRGRAQDVVQEAFLALWQSNSYCADKGSLRSFLLAIVRNRAIDALRKERRRSAQERSDETAATRVEGGDRTDVEVQQRETQRLLRAALATLPEAQQHALELAFFAGLTHSEIALRLNEPLGTIKGRLRLGLEKLRAEIDDSSR